MKKFKERELPEKLQEFQEKKVVEIEFDKSISGKLRLEETIIAYDSKNGYINIKSKNGNFTINTTLVYGYGIEDETIYIDLESLLIKIKAVN